MNLILANIEIKSVLIVVLIMLVISLFFGYLIMVVSKKFFVLVDEREEKISGCLAGANCGACGHPGCGGFAKALVEGAGSLDDCTVTEKEQKLIIAEVLGIKYEGGGISKVVVHCVGGNNAVDKNDFIGNRDCNYQNMIKGGRKVCTFACIGDGNCGLKCGIDAIKIKNGVAEIDQGLCISCGACIKACPKNIIGRIPEKAKVFVACSSKCKGKTVSDACAVGCFGCGICSRNCEFGAITMFDNLPMFDYEKCTACGKCIEKCPKKVIKAI